MNGRTGTGAVRLRASRVARFALIALVASLALAAAAPAASRGPAFVRAFGALGHPMCTTMCEAGVSQSGAGQFAAPNDTAVAASGDVYVADNANTRVDEFTQSGAFVRAFGKAVNATDGSDVCTAASGCKKGTGTDAAGDIFGVAGVAVTGSSDVYVADRWNSRIDEFTQSGDFVRAFGKGVNSTDGSDVCTAVSGCQAATQGAGAGELDGPAGVAVSGSGNVYVSDAANNRVVEFTHAGVFVQAFGKGVNSTDGSDVCTAATGCQAGSAGSGLGEIPHPVALAVSGPSDVYVADLDGHIDEFTQAGSFVGRFGTGPGSAAGEFDGVQGLAVGGSGDLFVTDFGNHRVDVLTATGTFVTAFGKGVNTTDGSDVCTTASGCQAGSSSDAAGEIGAPAGLAVSGSSDVYVADYANERIDEFSQSGTFVRAFGDGVGYEPFNCTAASGCQAGAPGSAAGQLNGPTSVAVSESGEVYVADSLNNRIDVFSQSGAFVRAFGRDVGGVGSDLCTTHCRPGTAGAGGGQLRAPSAVAVSGSGEVYVSDLGNNRVDEFSPSGGFVRAFGRAVNAGDGSDVCTTAGSCQAGTASGTGGALKGPQGVTTGASGDVYVADRLNQRIAEYTASGVFVRAFGKSVNAGDGSDVCAPSSTCQAGSSGGAAGQLNFPSGVAVSGAGDVYVADQYNGRIDVFSASGSFLRAFGKDVGGPGADTCTSSCQIGTGGPDAGQLAPSSGVAVLGSSDVYVAEGNNRVDEFTQSGAFLRAFGKRVNRADGSDVCTAASGCQGGDPGGDAGEFAGVFGVALNGSGEIYVADYGNERIDEFSRFVNSAPVPVDDSYSTNENTALTVSARASGVLANDTDADGDALTAVSYTAPSHGTLSHNADGTFTYTPAVNFHGSDSFTYKANDGTTDSASAATVTITVNAASPGPTPPAPVTPRIRLAISHRHVPRVGAFVKVRLICHGTAAARCAGTLALDMTKDTRRLKAAAAPGRDGHARFDIAVGRDGTVRVRVSSRLLRALHQKRRVIVMATARFTSGSGARATVKRKLTVIV